MDWLASLLQGRPRRRQDLQRRPRSATSPQLWLIVVDASASTRRHGALGQAKGLLAELFAHAYRARARIALLDAHGAHAQWHWQGQKASAALQDWLNELGAGGGSPLIDALRQAQQWLQRRQRAKPGERQRLLVITDGRLREWPALAASGCPTLVVDIESAPIRIGKARQLADQLGADYRHIETLPVSR